MRQTMKIRIYFECFTVKTLLILRIRKLDMTEVSDIIFLLCIHNANSIRNQKRYSEIRKATVSRKWKTSATGNILRMSIIWVWWSSFITSFSITARWWLCCTSADKSTEIFLQILLKCPLAYFNSFIYPATAT